MNKPLIATISSISLLPLFLIPFFPILHYTLTFNKQESGYIPYGGAIALTAISGFLSILLIVTFIVSMILFLVGKAKNNSK